MRLGCVRHDPEHSRPSRQVIARAIDGFSAQYVTITAPTSFTGCTRGIFRVWQLPLGAVNDMTAGETQRLWIVDAGDQRLVIASNEGAALDAAAKGELQRIIDSINIAIPN